MNPCLILTRNNLELTHKCVESVRAQDIPTEIRIYDNGSTDGTWDWAESSPDIHTTYRAPVNRGVRVGLNVMLSAAFRYGAHHILVLNNDVILPPWFYRYLLDYQVEFVTGVAVDDMNAIAQPAPICPLSLHPDFSAFLITKRAWDLVGPFDERMKIYCSDCDWHIRAHRAGLPLWKANVPYFHINSQTMKRAEPAEREAIQIQANLDREVFRSIYNCLPGSSEYEQLFK